LVLYCSELSLAPYSPFLPSGCSLGYLPPILSPRQYGLKRSLFLKARIDMRGKRTSVLKRVLDVFNGKKRVGSGYFELVSKF
jgi:hypothetical protein